MMERIYEIAGIGVRVLAPDGQLPKHDGSLTPFVSRGPWVHTLELEICPALSPPEGRRVFHDGGLQVYETEDTQIRYIGAVGLSLDGAWMRVSRRGDHSHVELKARSLPYGITSKVILNALGAEHLVTGHNGFLLHASYIRVNGKAILFTAVSGTGKSTQAALWEQHRGAELINGDRAVVRKDAAGFSAWGIPFSGSSRVGKNVTLPLAAIVCLSQAPETTITRLSGVRAFRQIWEGCSVNVWDSGDMALASRTVMEAVQTVPVFHLACTPDESAVIALEEALRGE